uniref:WASP homolog associated with actin, golgi membranes and microtubules n=1 Tax=Amphilophus citrinellus TaxID=61819 RepID=A0A3Q0R9H1_AMPCI
MNSIECERLDSLEGWVAVKNNIFEEDETFKLGFIVQWNVIESKFAVTCHNRTLQRQKRKSEPAADDPQMSWAGLFSVSDLRHIHQQFTCVADVLGGCFPDLSKFEEGNNIWELLFLNRRSGPEDDEERDYDGPCRKLEKYFSTAIDLCGRKIVLDTLFAQDDRDVEEEKLSCGGVCFSSSQLLQSHSGADRMVVLLSIYEEEDEAYQDLVTIATTFFQYLLQPFRDMRELACLYKIDILKSLEFEDLGPKRIAALEKEAEEWRKKAEDAVASIQDITVTYFAQTSKALAGMVKQMEEDKCRFGPAAWASAAPRLEKLRFLLAKETLQHMRATEMCLIQRADLRSAFEDGQKHDTVDRLELQFYETQLELYDAKFEILKNEEQLLVAQIEPLRRQIKELKEQVVYYDVCEDPEELQSMVHTGIHQADSPAVSQLKRRLQTLETKRGNICARRAYLRNKKVWATANEPRCFSLVPLSVSLCCLQKREKRKEEEQRRKEWVDKEREKTLSRLRSFREVRLSHCLCSAFARCSLELIKPKGILHRHSKKAVLIMICAAGQELGKTAISSAASSVVLKLFLLYFGIIAGTMDEVLASLQRGQMTLRKVPAPSKPRPTVDARSSLMSAIRQGVTLKKVRSEVPSSGDNELERSIKAAMMRMKKVAADSDEEDRIDDEAHNADWDS